MKFRSSILFLLLALLPLAGCNPAPQVSHYRVAKIRQPLDGMLAAVVPHDSAAWFFKLTGPADQVAPQLPAFRAFLQTIHFDGEQLRYEAPEHWHALGRSGMRYETFEIPSTGGGKPLELTVTTFPKPPGDEQAFLLSNINRWRDQIGLSAIGPDALSGESEQLPLDGTTATLVNLEGKLKATMSPPFAGARDGK